MTAKVKFDTGNTNVSNVTANFSAFDIGDGYDGEWTDTDTYNAYSGTPPLTAVPLVYSGGE